MRFVAFSLHGEPALGVRIGDEIIDLSAAGLPHSVDDLLLLGDAGLEAARHAVAQAKQRLPLAAVQSLPPVRAPSKAIAVGLNFAAHAAEGKFAPPDYPVLFHRYPSSWVGHQHPLVKPLLSDQFDYEGELVVVIGKPGRHIPRTRALEHVAGYSIFNDGSVRDYQLRSSQWMIGKNFDRTGGFGPELVTPDELPPGASGLRLQTRLNGEVVQDANTRNMIFDVATLIAVCSAAFRLQTGDLIITGTPAGVGLARTPPLFMKAGDICEVEIEGIGLLANPVIEEGERETP